ncbi:MAG TPA: hypothetical protein VLJ15_08920 [Gammaproteobacteria bacterium]|nr:hypothetical protein [Gammaproteobacteria bacterium]
MLDRQAPESLFASKYEKSMTETSDRGNQAYRTILRVIEDEAEKKRAKELHEKMCYQLLRAAYGSNVNKPLVLDQCAAELSSLVNQLEAMEKEKQPLLAKLADELKPVEADYARGEQALTAMQRCGAIWINGRRSQLSQWLEEAKKGGFADVRRIRPQMKEAANLAEGQLSTAAPAYLEELRAEIEKNYLRAVATYTKITLGGGAWLEPDLFRLYQVAIRCDSVIETIRLEEEIKASANNAEKIAKKYDVANPALFETFAPEPDHSLSLHEQIEADFKRANLAITATILIDHMYHGLRGENHSRKILLRIRMQANASQNDPLKMAELATRMRKEANEQVRAVSHARQLLVEKKRLADQAEEKQKAPSEQPAEVMIPILFAPAPAREEKFLDISKMSLAELQAENTRLETASLKLLGGTDLSDAINPNSPYRQNLTQKEKVKARMVELKQAEEKEAKKAAEKAMLDSDITRAFIAAKALINDLVAMESSADEQKAVRAGWTCPLNSIVVNVDDLSKATQDTLDTLNAFVGSLASLKAEKSPAIVHVEQPRVSSIIGRIGVVSESSTISRSSLISPPDGGIPLQNLRNRTSGRTGK